MDDLAEGLWTRLRNVLIALDRIDRLEGSTGFSGWVEMFQADPTQTEKTAHDWVLRAIRVASDPLNYEILHCVQSGEMTIAQLMGATRLSRVDASERVKELAQAGFLTQSLENDRVQGTRATQGIIDWIESLSRQIADHARGGLMKDNPPPRFHRPFSPLTDT